MKGAGIICSIIIVLAYCYLCYIMAQEQKKRTALLKDNLIKEEEIIKENLINWLNKLENSTTAKKENIIKEEKIIKHKKEKPLKN